MIGRVPVHSPKGHLDYFLRYAMTEAIRHQSAAFLYMYNIVNIYIMSVPASEKVHGIRLVHGCQH